MGPFAFALNAAASARAAFHVRAQGFKASANSDTFSQHLTGHRRGIVVERVENAKLQAIHSKAIGQFVVNLLLRDRSLRYAKTPERSGRNQMGMHRTRDRPVVRNLVRSGSMHWHPRRDRGTPGGVRPSIEVGGEVERLQLAVVAWLPRAIACAPDGAWWSRGSIQSASKPF